MKKIELFEKYIFGDIDLISSERYFVTVTSLVTSLFLLIICFVHLFVGLVIAPVFFAGGSSIVLFGLYYFVRFKNCLLIPKIILTVVGLIMLDFTWYSKFLSNGPVLFFILIFAALIIWVWNGRQLVVLITFYFINLAVLFYIDYNSPEYLFKYPSLEIRSVDIFTSIFSYSFLLIFLLYIVKSEFSRQKEKVIEVKDLYLELFNNTTIGLYQTTAAGKLILANPTLVKMLNFNSLEDLIQSGLTNRSNADSKKRLEFINTIEQKGEITNYESEWLTKNGDKIIVMEAAKAVKDADGKIIRIDGTVEDITEKKKIQKELIEAKEKAEQSDHLKSAFLANMSHEIRTPMNGILGFSELLKSPDLNCESQQQYIAIIEKSGNRMLNIINDIIDISKIEAGLMKLTIQGSNINQQIEYVYTFFKPEIEGKGMTVTFKNALSEKESCILTDHEKVSAILINLVKNAIKYTVKGSIELGYTVKGKYLEYYVKDTGVGIAKDRQDAIFERFIQAEIENKMARQGAGLGLSISKSYVEMLGGEIRVESELGVGSTFYFTIPYVVKPEQKPRVDYYVSNEEVAKSIRKLNILIAEDDEASEILISRIVKELSSEIHIARTGKEAVEICRNKPDIDLILMDVQMPGLDGYEATSQIRQFNKDVIIISQTAYGLTGDKEKSLKAGCNEYIAKPINRGSLLVLIQKYFKK